MNCKQRLQLKKLNIYSCFVPDCIFIKVVFFNFLFFYSDSVYRFIFTVIMFIFFTFAFMMFIFFTFAFMMFTFFTFAFMMFISFVLQ